MDELPGAIDCVVNLWSPESLVHRPPRKIVFIDAMSRNSNGKLVKRNLQTLL